MSNAWSTFAIFLNFASPPINNSKGALKLTQTGDNFIGGANTSKKTIFVVELSEYRVYVSPTPEAAPRHQHSVLGNLFCSFNRIQPHLPIILVS